MKEDNFKFYSVSIGDLKSLVDISRQTFEESYATHNDPENFELHLNTNFTPELLSAEINNPNSKFYFVKTHDQIVAYLKTNIGKAQTEPNHGDGMEIERIYVAKAYHRKGIGKLMLEKAEELARKLNKKYIWLGVWKENPEAIRFYQEMEFSKIGVHIFQLGHEAQIDYMMAKDLN